MWFATWDGLNRYDGYELKVYRQERDNPNSPGGNAYFAVYEDRQGIIWAGSQGGGGLSRFDPSTEQWTRFQYDPDDPHSLGSNNVYAITEDSSGRCGSAPRGADSTVSRAKLRMGKAASPATGTIPMIPAVWARILPSRSMGPIRCPLDRHGWRRARPF